MTGDDWYDIIGIDPGLVDTAVVRLQLSPLARWFAVDFFVVNTDTPHAAEVMNTLRSRRQQPTHYFIEKYLQRGKSYGTNSAMQQLEHEFRVACPQAKFINNTGAKQVVKLGILVVLGMDDFPTTHHQDLQAAARILVYGMLKDPELNAVLFDMINSYLKGGPWKRRYP